MVETRAGADASVSCIPISPDRMEYITRSLAQANTHSEAVYRTTPFGLQRVSNSEKYNTKIVKMKFVLSLVVLSCALFEARGYPYAYYPAYGNVDSLSYGDGARGGMALSRYYNPYYDQRGVGGGMAAFMVATPQQQSSQYYLPDRRRQTQQEVNYVPPQQNEVYYPQQPDNQAFVPTEATELAEPEKAEPAPTTEKAVAVPELIEPEIEEVPEEPVQKPKKAVNKKKQVKRPIDDDDEEEYAPKMPAAAFFPMFFGGYGGRGAGGPGGPTAIANAYSTGKGGVATSHATAYGNPRIEERV